MKSAPKARAVKSSTQQAPYVTSPITRVSASVNLTKQHNQPINVFHHHPIATTINQAISETKGPRSQPINRSKEELSLRWPCLWLSGLPLTVRARALQRDCEWMGSVWSATTSEITFRDDRAQLL